MRRLLGTCGRIQTSRCATKSFWLFSCRDAASISLQNWLVLYTKWWPFAQILPLFLNSSSSCLWRSASICAPREGLFPCALAGARGSVLDWDSSALACSELCVTAAASWFFKVRWSLRHGSMFDNISREKRIGRTWNPSHGGQRFVQRRTWPLRSGPSGKTNLRVGTLNALLADS